MRKWIIASLLVLSAFTYRALAQDTLWPSTAVPGVVDMGADSALNMGVRFQSSVAGTISGIRFYKGVNNTGTHIGTLYTDTGTQLAQATFTGESASGWQQVNFTPVSINANTTYVAAYLAPNGHWSRSVNYFYTSGYSNPPLSSPENGTNGEYNGCGLYNSSPAFPGNTTGNNSNYWVDIVFNPSSGSAPGAPTNLQGNAVSSSQINLTWTASTGSPTGYYVYRNGTQVGSPSTNSYSDTGLTANTQYSYYVAAYNSYGTSGNSSTIQVTTLSSSVTIWSSSTVPGTVDSGDGTAVNLGVRFQSSVAGTISGIRFYKASTNTGTHVGTLYSDTGTQLAQATFSGESASGWQQVTFTPVSINANTTYVAAYHTTVGHYSDNNNYFTSAYVNSPLTALADNPSGDRNAVYTYSSSVVFPTSTYESCNYWVDIVFNPTSGGSAPPAPTNLQGTAAGPTQINLTWTASSGATGYYVYRNSTKVGSPTTNSYSDTGLTANTQYSYYVAAYNSYGTSGNSSTIQVTTTPAAPTNLQGTPVSSSQINLTWTASSGATGYQVFRNGTQVGSPSTNSYSDTGLAASTQYSYYVKATANGLVSPASSTIYVTTLSSGGAPPPPTNLQATAASSSQINLTWNTSSGATGYQVFRMGTQIASPSTNSYNDTGLANSTEYSYWVTATSSGGTSAPSAMAYMTTNNSGSAPPAPTNLAGTAASSTSVVLTWTAVTDAAGVGTYNVYRNSTLVGSVSMNGYSLTTYTDTGLSANTQYSYYVVAEDGNSVLSPNSSTIQVTTLASNSNAPPAPTNLQGRASSSTQIDLIWKASVDSAGVTSYNVYRNSTKVGSAAAAAYTDTGLSASTQYSYYVVAVDAGSRTSGNSSTIQVTTLSSTQGGLPTQLQNFFPLGADGQPVSPNNLSTWATRGANTMIRIGGGQNFDVWNTTADTLGLKYIRGPANNPALDIGNTNLLAWHQNDEPCSGDPSSGLVTFFAQLKAIDFTRPVSVNLAPGGMLGLGGCSAAQNQPYIVNASDWAMNDIYPIAGWDEPNDIIVPNNWVGEALQQMAAISQGRPQMQFVECAEQNLSWCPQCPAPTPAQFHTEFWDAIINGARGVFLFPEAISPFVWDNTTAAMDTQITADWATVTALTTALQTAINPSGMSATVTAPLEAGWRNSTHQYFIVNNTGASALNNQTITLTGIGSATQAVVYGESRNVNIVSGVITDNFAADSIHIYQVN